MANLGGNQVSAIDLLGEDVTVFADSPYYYGIHHVKPGGVLSLPRLQAMTIYSLEMPATTLVAEERTQTQIRSGDCIQAHQLMPKVVVRDGGRCSFLVAGVAQSKLRPEITVLRDYEIKKVAKPWGHELWMSGEHPEYALKQVCIRAPHKTSLQYHDYKHETIVLFSGSARLHHKRDESVPHSSLGEGDLTATTLAPGSVAHIRPPVLHRFEACTDLTLYEASTPHLHDVIRVSDDSNRPDGRIESEHTAACRG